MLSELPVIKLPDTLTRICELDLKNTKQCHSDIMQIIEKDPFLQIFIKKVFAEYSQKGGIATILNALGWQGFRNRLGEAYLFYAKNGHYPNEVKVEEVKFALELEKRFDFMFAENNSRVFLLGMYLKLCEIEFENNQQFVNTEYQGIPPQVDEILTTGKSKSDTPDWLIVIVWSFYSKFGKPKCLDYFKTSKGNLDEIIPQVSKKDYGDFIMDLLVYGHAINDTQFFSEEKV